MKTIKFTNAECAALLHRLSSWDCIKEVFADTEGMEHLAEPSEDRCIALSRELENGRHLTVDENSELDREILVEAIEGSTWVAIHDPENDTNNTHQAKTAAFYGLVHAAKKVADAFGINETDIDVPNF